jgi:hypothetical protein
MKTLHLNLKKKWFDMIASGEKKEEYREIKPYWDKRLVIENFNGDKFKHFDVVVFKNGYSKDAPTITVRIKHIGLSQGKKEWGAGDGKLYYCISLGKIINTLK